MNVKSSGSCRPTPGLPGACSFLDLFLGSAKHLEHEGVPTRMRPVSSSTSRWRPASRASPGSTCPRTHTNRACFQASILPGQVASQFKRKSNVYAPVRPHDTTFPCMQRTLFKGRRDCAREGKSGKIRHRFLVLCGYIEYSRWKWKKKRSKHKRERREHGSEQPSRALSGRRCNH
jgi:hypothetical protein